MISKIDLCLTALIAFCVRSMLRPEVSLGDAVAILALAALYGYQNHLKASKENKAAELVAKEKDVRDAYVGDLMQLKQELQDAKSAINAIKMGKSLGKII